MKMRKCFSGSCASTARMTNTVPVMPVIVRLLILMAVLLTALGRSSASAQVTANSITVVWTAPGDDSATGIASSYDVRYSQSNITASNWASAIQVSGEPVPKPALSSESFMVQGLSPGVTYYVAIRTCDHAGNWSGISNVAVATTTSIGVGTDDENADVPSDFQLRQNYPNPFNPSTTIEFSIPRNEQVQLVIFNVLGERVTTLLSDYLAAGHHQVTWNGNDLYGKPVASGVYLYRLEAGSKVWVRKMALLK